MDVISLGKANKAKKEIEQLKDRLGMEGTEQDLDIRDVYENVDERLTALEERKPDIEFFNKVGEVSAHTAINLNKHNLRVSSLINQARYKLTDMIVDDLEDDSGIDYKKSFNIVYDNGIVKQDDQTEQAELVFITEAFHTMNMFFISSLMNPHSYKQIDIDLSEGVFNNTEISSGQIRLKKQEDDSFVFQGIYETDPIELGENVSLAKVDMNMNLPNDTTITPFIAFSDDGINFTNYSKNLQGQGKYAKLKFEFESSLETVIKTLSLFIKEGNGVYKNGSFKLNNETDNVILKRNIQKYNGFIFDDEKVESYKGIYPIMYRMKRTVSKGWNR